ncbi:MAG: riboflavin synthase [Treponema sp.]|jgi:riboflavin synthase|nr:riboflavin synthase [Treponema sp.]
MFTGIVEELGTVLALNRASDRLRLTVGAKTALEGSRLGDSISIDGVCQTITEIGPDFFTVAALAESLAKTTLGRLNAGVKVNLERALRLDSRLGGHIVQGHVNAVAPIRELRRQGENVYLAVEAPAEQLRYCIREGSIALDGMSLTIAELRGSLIRINIIPATIAGTTLAYKKTGDLMNLETDIIGRYVERLLSVPAGKGLSAGRLQDLGF